MKHSAFTGLDPVMLHHIPGEQSSITTCKPQYLHDCLWWECDTTVQVKMWMV